MKTNNVKKSIFKPIIFATIVMIAILAFYIPYITDKNSSNTIIANSLNSVKQIKLTRAYYSNNVVRDIKKFAPQKIKFSYEHKGVNGVIPLPTTLIHDLSRIFSEKTGIKYKLYSEYPFENRAGRVLTKFQKEAIAFTKKSEDGTYIKRDIIDGKEVLRVAVTDYMTEQSCVKCHNTHPDRTWEAGKWKLGDKRGVLEIITPLDKEIVANNILKYSILSLIFATIIFLLGYFYLIFVRRENELVHTIDETSGELLEEKEISQTRQVLLEEYKKAIDIAAIVSKTNIDGKITYVNDKFCEVTGYDRSYLIGRTHNVINNPKGFRAESKRLWNTILGKKVYNGTIKNINKNGDYFYVDITIIPILDKLRNIQEFMAISYDVTRRIRAIEYAYTDQLTGIANRNKFEDTLSFELDRAKRYKNTFSLAILDIDYFKKVNDKFGHPKGDEVLVGLTKAISKNLRKTDLFARWGGEEFVILFNNTSLKDALHSADNFREIIETQYFDKAGVVTASFGLTEYREGDVAELIIERADKALYQAKNAGRNCVRVI